MHHVKLLASIVILSISAAGVARADDEEKVDFDKAPAAVQTAVKKTLGENKLSDLSKESEDGKTIFEAEYEAAGVEKSASFTEDGTLVEQEEEIKPADAPAAVTDALTKAIPGGKIKEASKVTVQDKSFFEFEVKADHQKHEIQIASDGKILSDHVKKAKAEKDEDKDNDKETDKADKK